MTDSSVDDIDNGSDIGCDKRFDKQHELASQNLVALLRVVEPT
jgi:hypothetical protein